MSRPEFQAPPEMFYGDSEARKYADNSRMIGIQTQMAERCIELLNLPPDTPPLMLLDLGCGSGLSGEVMTERGHQWVGMDIAPAMLQVALERETEGSLVLKDLGEGLPFRPGVFDGAISVSAIQWLCNADKKSHHPKKRLKAFFETLYAVLKRGARAVLQFYPANAAQMELITTTAMASGFHGGMVVDYPHSTRAKKYYLCLFAGAADPSETTRQTIPAALGTGEDGGDGRGDATVPVNPATKRRDDRREAPGRKKQRKGGRQWVLQKKERQRRQGRDVRPDTKYTARRRKRLT